MCYSAEVWADYRRYIRDYQVEISIKEFFNLFYRRRSDKKIQVPKAMEMAFSTAPAPDAGEIKQLIDEHRADEARKFEELLFKQRARLATAERSLAAKETKAARESQRIAGNKIEWARSKIADLFREEARDRDARIFPGWYAPVLVMEEGRRVLKPMRYQCRPAGMPPSFDDKYPGTYNARRNNLTEFWKGLFGFSHGIVVANAFYEHVNKHRLEGRELAPGEAVEDVILEFRPRPAQPMLVACLYSHWKGTGDEPDLLSFAAITDEPPPEVAAAGHDRCIIPIRHESIDAWLDPSRSSLERMQEILDERERPFYEHLSMAA